MPHEDESLLINSHYRMMYEQAIADLKDGATLDEYRIERLLGIGRMGTVYEVRHMILARLFAIKVLPCEFTIREDALQRFEDEARVMANLDHPNIVKVDDFRQTRGLYWFRMELALGDGTGAVSLQDLANRNNGVIDQTILAALLEDALKGIAYAQGKGIIHQRLKPSNILLFPKPPDSVQARVSDYTQFRIQGDVLLPGGLASAMKQSVNGMIPAGSEHQTSTGSISEILDYAAPEQVKGGNIDARTDVYQIGMIMYRLLTGQKLSPKSPKKINPSLHVWWDNIVIKALETRPDNRFANAEEMLTALQTKSCPPSVKKNRIHDQKSVISPGIEPMAIDSVPGKRTARTDPSPKMNGLKSQNEIGKQKKEPGPRSFVFIALGIAIALMLIFLIADIRKQPTPISDTAVEDQEIQDWSSENYYGKEPRQGRQSAKKISQINLARQDLSTSLLDLGGTTSLEIVYLSGGSFTMGATDEIDKKYLYAKPAHNVDIKGFWIGKFEVTQKQYSEVMHNNPSVFIGLDHPVENVSWQDAMQFCRIVSQKTGLLVALPTEAQWEYACRAGTKTEFSWGADKDDDRASMYAWYKKSVMQEINEEEDPWSRLEAQKVKTQKEEMEEIQAQNKKRWAEREAQMKKDRYKPRSYKPRDYSTKKTPAEEKESTEALLRRIRKGEKDPMPEWKNDKPMTEVNAKRVPSPQPVGMKAANIWRLCDMEGNVQEWCMDAWSEGYEKASSDGSAAFKRRSSLRMIRGGCYKSDISHLRSFYERGDRLMTRAVRSDFALLLTPVLL